MTYQQHGVTIGGHTYRVDENGKFLPNQPRHDPEEPGERQNGNNTPKEHDASDPQ